MRSSGRNVFLLVSSIVFHSTFSFAIPADVDLLPARHETEWGGQVNGILKRDFENIKGQAGTYQYFVKSGYGMTDRLILDAKLGMGNVRFQRADGITLRFPHGFAGGYGFRYLLGALEDPGRFVFGFQHISCHPFKDVVEGVEYRVIWDEWQGTFIFSHARENITFYTGPQYTALQLKYKENGERRRLKAEDVWGACVGVVYHAGPRTSFTLGIRCGAETAADMGIRHTF